MNKKEFADRQIFINEQKLQIRKDKIKNIINYYDKRIIIVKFIIPLLYSIIFIIMSVLILTIKKNYLYIINFILLITFAIYLYILIFQNLKFIRDYNDLTTHEIKLYREGRIEELTL